jgi:hypothetical protein
MNSEKGGGDEGERIEGKRGKNLVAKYTAKIGPKLLSGGFVALRKSSQTLSAYFCEQSRSKPQIYH